MFLPTYIFLFILPAFISSFNNGHINRFKTSNVKIFMNDNPKNYFSQILDYNLEVTKKLGLNTVDIDERFIKDYTKDGSGTIQNYCFSNNYFRKVRFTYLDDNPKYQYFGLVMHPNYNYDIPIFNFEVILYNNEKTVYTLNMVKMDKSKIYNEKYVKPFMKIKNKYPELHENAAVKLSGYTIFGNHISEAILLGKFIHNKPDVNSVPEIYNSIVIPSFTEYISTYLDFFEKPIKIHLLDEIENIKNRHKLFDMKKAFVESRYDIRKCFQEDWYRSMLYDFFYELEKENQE